MAQFTISGFTALDVLDFAKSKQWQEFVEVDGEQVENPIGAGQHCKDYLKMMFTNDILAERLRQAKAAVEAQVSPILDVE